MVKLLEVDLQLYVIKKGWEFEKQTHIFSTKEECLNYIIDGNYVYLSNYKRMCKNHNWVYNIDDYDNTIIKALKNKTLKREDVKEWKLKYNESISD